MIVEVPQNYIDDYPTISLRKETATAKEKVIDGKVALTGKNIPSKPR
jgi:hypothetical protein